MQVNGHNKGRGVVLRIYFKWCSTLRYSFSFFLNQCLDWLLVRRVLKGGILVHSPLEVWVWKCETSCCCCSSLAYDYAANGSRNAFAQAERANASTRELGGGRGRSSYTHPPFMSEKNFRLEMESPEWSRRVLLTVVTGHGIWGIP